MKTYIFLLFFCLFQACKYTPHPHSNGPAPAYQQGDVVYYKLTGDSVIIVGVCNYCGGGHWYDVRDKNMITKMHINEFELETINN